MKTKLSLTFLLSFSFYLLSSQIPAGFNYQAVAHNSAGAPIMNTTIQVKMGILSDTLTPVVVWEELHSSVKTYASGVFNLVIGTGIKQSGSASAFSDIDWTKTPLFLKIQINYLGAWKYLGTSRLWSVPYAMVTNDIGAPLKKLAVTGETDNLEEALFEVKNKDGQTIFAVYNEGVSVYVSDGDEKGVKGGFAIGGFGTTKVSSQPYFIVRPDSIRMYLYDTVKAVKGGFAIGGYGTTKTGSQNYLFVSSDSIRAYIDNSSAKGPKGGFAIGGFGTVKDQSGHYFNVSTDTSNIINPSQNRILWYPLKNAFLAGRVLVEKPDSVGINSFATGYESKAMGQYSQAMGYQAIARGIYSTSIGYQSVANRDNSFAFGQWAQAKSYESYAFGRGAIAEGFRSFAFGSAGVDSLGQTTDVAYAKGPYSFAFGMGSQALGASSFALGVADTAIGVNSFSFGLETSSTGWGAISMGRSTKASGGFSTSMGWYTKATGTYAMAVNNNTTASGENSFAGGAGSESQGVFSFSFGQSTKASADASTAIGEFTSAIGRASVAMGSNSRATGITSTALGSNTLASGNTSVAFGESTASSGPVSTTFGYHTQASGTYTTAIGNHTISSGENSFAGGAGSLSQGVFSFSFGQSPTSSGSASVALGGFTLAKGDFSFAMGNSSQAKGDASAAFGGETIAKSNSSFVLGMFNDTTNMTTPNGYTLTDPVFVIGNGFSNDNRKNAFTVLYNSNVGINMVNPQQKLDIAGGNGRVESGYDWLTNSDIRYKKNICTIEYALEMVMNLRGVRYDLTNDPEPSGDPGKHIGFIAQELETVVPEVVVTGSDGYKSVAYDKITAVLTEAIKEQQKQIDSYKSENDNLKSQLQTLQQEVEQIKAFLATSASK